MKLSPALIAVIVIVVLVVGGGGVYLLGRPSGGNNTTSSTAVAAPDLKQQFSKHINTISSRDVTAVLADYQATAVVVWTGYAAGLGGVYQGTGNIRLLYASALSTANSISFVPHNIIQTNESGGKVQVNSTLTFSGKSQILGSFNGSAISSATYSYAAGSWGISVEHWNYLAFNTSSAGGATTFPEWQKIGPINPSNRSPDWLHNFVWDYGGYAIAIAIYGLAAAIALAYVARHLRRRSV